MGVHSSKFFRLTLLLTDKLLKTDRHNYEVQMVEAENEKADVTLKLMLYKVVFVKQ